VGHSEATASGNPFKPTMETTTVNLGQDIASAAAVASMEAPRVCGNPLRDEPDPVVVAAVKRFGLVGLVVCAVGAWVGRWWSSVTRSEIR